MRRRLLRSTSLIAVAAVVVLGVPLAVVGTELQRQRGDERLERRADAIALRLARAEAQRRPLTTALIADLLPRHSAARLSVNGRLLTFGRPPAGSRATVTSGDGGPLGVTLVAPASARSDDVVAVWIAVGAAALAALVAAAVLAWIQAGRLAAPLEELAGRVERVGRGDYDDRPVAGHLEEIDAVQRALNRADERIEALVRREREFTANASHQLRTPLTGLRMRLEELRSTATDAAAAEEAEAAIAQADRLVDTIEHLEEFARHRDDEPASVDVGALVGQHVESEGWAARYAAEDRALVEAIAPGQQAVTHAETLRQVLDVLLDNALRHGRGTTRLRCDPARASIKLRVIDEGDALGQLTGEGIFARGSGEGSGIGLSVARELVRRDGGDLSLVEVTPTTFEVLLRRAGAAAHHPETSARDVGGGAGQPGPGGLGSRRM